MKKLGFILLATAVTGCTGNLQNLQNIGKESDPTRFYSLASTAQKTDGKPFHPVIGIGPVTVADYLDRSQIVIRKSPTALELGEFDRWAGKTDREIQRAVAADLAELLGTQRILPYPWKSGATPDISVEIYIERFEFDEGSGKARLTSLWQVYGRDERAPLSYHRSVLEKESSSAYETIADSLSALTGDLSREIAAALHQKH